MEVQNIDFGDNGLGAELASSIHNPHLGQRLDDPTITLIAIA